MRPSVAAHAVHTDMRQCPETPGGSGTNLASVPVSTPKERTWFIAAAREDVRFLHYAQWLEWARVAGRGDRWL
jgi:hypothetical protein